MLTTPVLTLPGEFAFTIILVKFDVRVRPGKLGEVNVNESN